MTERALVIARVHAPAGPTRRGPGSTGAPAGRSKPSGVIRATFRDKSKHMKTAAAAMPKYVGQSHELTAKRVPRETAIRPKFSAPDMPPPHSQPRAGRTRAMREVPH